MPRTEQISTHIETSSHQIELSFQHLLQENWVQFLEDLKFVGNKEVAQQLIVAFIEGMREIYKLKEMQRKIPDNFSLPFLLIDDSYPALLFCTRAGGRAIYVNLSQLAFASVMSQNEEHQVSDLFGKPSHIGTLSDFFFAGGNEEMTHAIDLQKKGTGNENSQVFTDKNVQEALSTTEYDAGDMEYRGLGSRIFALRKKGASINTITVLFDRLRAAIAWRKEHRHHQD